MSRPIASYENLVISHSSTISTIESSLRSIAWFLPGRFKDAELASEALTAFVNLLSFYHDALLVRRVALVRELDPKAARPLIPPPPLTRYTRAWAEKDKIYAWAGSALQVIRYTELLLEMGLKRSVGKRGKWRGIVLIELLKAVLRLVLLQRTRRPIVSPPIAERDIDPATLPSLTELPTPPSVIDSPPLKSTGQNPEHLKNNHIPFSTRDRSGQQDNGGKPHPLLTTPLTTTTAIVENFLLPRALSPSLLRDPRELMDKFRNIGELVGELAWILRPLIYVLLLRPSRSPTRSKMDKALIASITLTFVSQFLRPTPPPSSTLARNEFARRDRDLVWYLFRGSIWDSFTRPKLAAIAGAGKGGVVGGLVGGLVGNWIWLIDEYYYYTAT